MVYNRKGAVSYAQLHWWKACHDLYICTTSGAPGTKPDRPYVKVAPGTYFAGDTQHARTIDAIILGKSDIEDCTHFISCCLGPMGGGLAIPSDFPSGPYGRLAPKRLIESLDASRHLDTLARGKLGVAKIPGGLDVGDLIAYSNGGAIGHCAMYLGNGTITCHTSCRWLAAWTDIDSFSDVTFLHVK
jgi:hypothetical protein